MNRRLFLKSALASSAVISAVGAGLLTPNAVFAGVAEFKKASNDMATTIAGAAKGSFKFKAPKIAENGAVVPLTVDATKISGVSNIAIYVKNNATPLAVNFALTGGALGYVSTRVKMGKSSPITAVVTVNNKSSIVTKDVKVTVGGCGG